MAIDAGYRGEEARHMAQILEEEAMAYEMEYQRAQSEEAYVHQCSAEGHPYHGDDEPAPEGREGRCYCGEVRYPKGGPDEEE